MTLPIVPIPHPRTRINKLIDSFSILFSWNPVLCPKVSLQTPPRHAIPCPITLRPLAPRRKLHSARGWLVVVVLRFHNNDSNFHDVFITFHQEMFLFRRIHSATTCVSLLDRQHSTFGRFPGATGNSGAVSWGAPILIFATSL